MRNGAVPSSRKFVIIVRPVWLGPDPLVVSVSGPKLLGTLLQFPFRDLWEKGRGGDGALSECLRGRKGESHNRKKKKDWAGWLGLWA